MQTWKQKASNNSISRISSRMSSHTSRRAVDSQTGVVVDRTGCRMGVAAVAGGREAMGGSYPPNLKANSLRRKPSRFVLG